MKNLIYKLFKIFTFRQREYHIYAGKTYFHISAKTSMHIFINRTYTSVFYINTDKNIK